LCTDSTEPEREKTKVISFLFLLLLMYLLHIILFQFQTAAMYIYQMERNKSFTLAGVRITQTDTPKVPLILCALCLGGVWGVFRFDRLMGKDEGEIPRRL
jgi:hypothetical protein